MKDFGLGWLFFAGIVTGIVVAAGFIVRFRLLRCCQIAAAKSLEPFKTKDIPFYYSSYAVKQECVRKFSGFAILLKIYWRAEILCQLFEKPTVIRLEIVMKCYFRRIF